MTPQSPTLSSLTSSNMEVRDARQSSPIAWFKYPLCCVCITDITMDIDRIASELKFANRIGQTLSTEEIISLQSSVLKLSHEYKFERYNFWGRVEGTSANYYIVEGVNYRGATHFPTKKYFWSSEDFRFAELPAQRNEFAGRVRSLGQFFSGQHEKILIKGGGQAGKAISLNGEDFVVKAKNFTELDRLSLVVHQIDQDCHVVPVGAYKMIPTHELIDNPAFLGLRVAQATALDHYAHLRAPTHPDKKILIECDKCLEREDFLDTLSQDPLKDAWSVQTDESKTEVTIRSLLWPGYVSYHRANSSVFGGVYLGTGVQNYDLPFIV